MKKATIDRNGCIGCGVCASTCPEVFEIDDEGKATVVSEVLAEYEASAYEAAEECPVGVISIG
ncbi:MAG: ferredoxin [Sphaerochaetaceae bacterium]|jgi:ferredoxin